MTSTLQEFLLFDFPGWTKDGKVILDICKLSLFPVFVFSLLADKISSNPNPIKILKNLFIAQLIILSIPLYYNSVAGFGFKIGDSILKEQKVGLIANWNKFKVKAEKKAKEEKKNSGILSTVVAFFSFDGTDMVEKAAGILILICILLIKVIYSVVYYATYCTAGILAVLSVIPTFGSYFGGIFKSILYLIITAVLVAIALKFLNDVLFFEVSKNGFIENIEGIAKFIVLCFVLLGTLKIGHSVVNGSGAGDWAGSMGSMLGAGLAFKTMGIGGDATKTMARMGIGKASSSSKSLFTKAAGLGIKPFTAIGGTLVEGAKNSLQSSVSAIESKHSIGNKKLSNNLKSNGNKINSQLGSSKANSFVSSQYVNISDKGASYKDSFSKITASSGESIRFSSAINPINHAKASLTHLSGKIKTTPQNIRTKMGIPPHSKNLSLKEKAVFAANKVVNSKNGLSNKDQIQNTVVRKKISKMIERG